MRLGKQKGIINVRGKVGGTVFTGGKYGNRVRTAPELTEARKKAKATLPQLHRTLAQNGIASTINKAVAHYAQLAQEFRRTSCAFLDNRSATGLPS